MSEIKYIGFFDIPDSDAERYYVTSAVNKMTTIYNSLLKCGYSVEIVSMSPVTEPKFRLYTGKTEELKPGLRLRKFLSWGGKQSLLSKTRTVWHLAALFGYLLLKIRKEDVVIVYHSLSYFNIINLAKRIKKFRLILEVEEVYQDVDKPKYSKMAEYEQESFRNADAYIFSTELLDKKINQNNKPYAVSYGTYQTESQIADKFDDGKIHVVYAGTFDPRKGGATAAVSAAEFLPENYHMHILGFGDEKEIENIRLLIEKCAEKSKCTITYDGLKKGTDFTAFLQKCHIGLSTQNPAGGFNDTSFPSKILTYMANGLSVVSVAIPVVIQSEIGRHTSLYKEQNPHQIAEAIISAPLINDNRMTISELDRKFTKRLEELITEVKEPYSNSNY